MASKKPQHPIPPPNTGVRKDVNKLVQTAEMAEEGTNCLYFDGVIRPRPAMTAQEFGTQESDAWKLLYEDGDIAGYHLTAYVQMDNGTIIGNFVNTAQTAQQIYYTTDMGISWQVTAHHPNASPTNTFTKAMYIFGGYLFMFELFDNVHADYQCLPDPTIHVPVEKLYRADLSAFPTTLTFTTLGPIEIDAGLYQVGISSPYYCSAFWPECEITYDSTTGHLLVMHQRSTSGLPMTWGLKNALTTVNWATDWYFVDGDIRALLVEGAWFVQPWYVNREWLVASYLQAPFSFPFITVKNTLWIREFTYQSGSGEFEYGTQEENLVVSEIQTGADVNNHIINIGPHGELSGYGAARRGVGLEDTTYSEFVVLFGGGVVPTAPAGQNGGNGDPHGGPLELSIENIYDAWKFRLASPDDGDPIILDQEILKTWPAGNNFGMQLFDLFLSAGRLATYFQTEGTGPWDVYGTSSDDDAETWKDTAVGDFDITYNTIDKPVYNETTKQHFIADSLDGYAHTKNANEMGVTKLWLAPTTGGESNLGATTAMFQMDMDDEDAVVVQGTTKHLLRLDRNTGLWNRLSANHSETVDNAPTGSWYDLGDIPPLGVSNDRSEYVSGTTIDGTYGTHPFVFRSFEAQGNTFLLATNGQCRPLCYHYSMNGGFARRMGEVPLNDPNDLPDWDPLSFPIGYLRTGNLAPVARCMAVGANRVILANLPSSSPYGVEVSGFNDPDRGWGLEQFTLLGDTPGEIVGMNELSALSVAMYKTDAVYQVIAQTEFLGVAAPFRFELSKAGISGPCSPGSILRNFDGKHAYLARDGGVYMYDGVAPIDGGRNIRRMIQGNIDLNALGQTWGMVDTERKLIWFFYPAKNGLVNRGIVISTDQGYPWPVWPVELPGGWNFAAGGAVFLEDDITIGEVGRLGDYTDETLGSFSSGHQQLLMGTESNVWFSQKWIDDGDYSDSGKPIRIELLNGWTTPGGAHRWTADEVYHIFSSPDPEMELLCTLKAQQFGEEIIDSKAVPISAGRLRRRTRHRISGLQFAVELKGAITRFFSWGGGVMTAKRSGDR